MDATGEKFTEGPKENGKVRAPGGQEEGCCPGGPRAGLVPLEYRNELKHLFKLAGPVVSCDKVIKQ